MTPTPDGKGYWLKCASDVARRSSTTGTPGSSVPPAALKLNQPIVGMAATPDGKGYWLVSADGGTVYNFTKTAGAGSSDLPPASS